MMFDLSIHITNKLVAARLALRGIKSYGAGPCLGGFSFVGVQLGPDYVIVEKGGRTHIRARFCVEVPYSIEIPKFCFIRDMWDWH